MDCTNASEMFTTFCSDLLVSADDVETLFGFSAVAITAWNSADKTEEDLALAVDKLKRQLRSDVVTNDGKTIKVEELVRTMITRKKSDFNEYAFKIVKAGFENEQNSIKVNVETAN